MTTNSRSSTWAVVSMTRDRRFISPDHWVTALHQGQNRYGYVANNPHTHRPDWVRSCFRLRRNRMAQGDVGGAISWWELSPGRFVLQSIASTPRATPTHTPSKHLRNAYGRGGENRTRGSRPSHSDDQADELYGNNGARRLALPHSTPLPRALYRLANVRERGRRTRIHSSVVPLSI